MNLQRHIWGSHIGEAELRASSQTAFYEVVPSAQIAIPAEAEVGFAAKQRLVDVVLAKIVPELLELLALGDGAKSMVGAGGYDGRTNPSIQTRVFIDDPSSRVLAAALGWILRQQSVLVADLDDREEATTGYVMIDFGDAPLTPEFAHSFFEMAGSVNGKLSDGYTAFENDMLFLNLSSEYRDEAFTADLATAAKRFGREARVGATGKADARFEANEWKTAPDGEQYAARLGDRVRAIAPLRDLHTQLVTEWIRSL